MGQMLNTLMIMLVVGTVAFACSDDATSKAYGMSVTFKPDATASDANAVEAYLRDLDSDMELLAELSLPPILHATWTSANVSCAKITPDLESRAHVAKVDCREGGQVVPIASPTG
jgi:hypothetical protein